MNTLKGINKFFDMEVFDTKKLGRYDQEMISTLAALYTREGKLSMAGLTAAIVDRNQQGVRFFLHKFTGSSYSVGALNVLREIKKLKENPINHMEWDDLSAECDNIQKAFDEFVDYAKSNLIIELK